MSPISQTWGPGCIYQPCGVYGPDACCTQCTLSLLQVIINLTAEGLASVHLHCTISRVVPNTLSPLWQVVSNLTAESLASGAVYKEMFLTAADTAGLHSEQKGLIDFLVLARSARFVGFGEPCG